MRTHKLEKTIEIDGKKVVQTCVCEDSQIPAMEKAGWKKVGSQTSSEINEDNAEALAKAKESVTKAEANMAEAKDAMAKAKSPKQKTDAEDAFKAAKKALEDAQSAYDKLADH